MVIGIGDDLVAEVARVHFRGFEAWAPTSPMAFLRSRGPETLSGMFVYVLEVWVQIFMILRCRGAVMATKTCHSTHENANGMPVLGGLESF
jgi:hypothetical protein